MAGFKMLKETSANFDEELKRTNGELFSAKPSHSSEEVLAKKLDDLRLFSSKFRLLHAKEQAETPQVAERLQSQADILEDYGETVQKYITEHAVVKSIMQSRILLQFLTTPNQKLDPELLKRKHKTIEALKEYRNAESVHHQLSTVLQEKNEEYSDTRHQWHDVMMQLSSSSADSVEEQMDEENPLFIKIQTLSDKIEMMRWLIGRFVGARAPEYDWIGDPLRRVGAFALARRRCDVASFLVDDDEE